jgi:hypothetical protein
MTLYDQNFVRRMVNMYRRRDPLTYQSKLKPFCEPSKKMLDEDDIKKLVLHDMQTALTLPNGVPVIAESGVGDNWLTAH